MTTIFPTARDQAKAQTESIAAMVARLEHARTCTGADSDDCDLFGSVVLEALGYELGTERLYDALGNPDIPDQRAEYHDEDAALKAILDHGEFVLVRSAWMSPGGDMEAVEYSIDISTMPYTAVRVQGNLRLGTEWITGVRGTPAWAVPVTAYAEHRGGSVRDGWDTTWTRYDPPHPAHQRALLAYAAEILAWGDTWTE